MAKFEGIIWADRQMRYGLPGKDFELLEGDAKVYAVSRSIHYALFLAFEGIRFFCRRTGGGGLEAVFLNWQRNLERLRNGIAFNLGRDQAALVPSVEELERLFIDRYFRAPALRPFFAKMAEIGAQGYFRPFTVDEEQSIGVTFPAKPSIRASVSRYDRYLGEPFSGVVVPNLVRAVGVNRTGCLKLGVNYLMSVKAVEAAKTVVPEAAAALFLDDQLQKPLAERNVSEWDSSCCLFALRDGTVVKIPEHELILPSVTIGGIAALLRDMGVAVEERHMPYGELLERTYDKSLVAVCSVGTAGILNRCARLVLVDGDNRIAADHAPDAAHPLYAALAEAKDRYWKIYRGEAKAVAGMTLSVYPL